MVDESLMLDFVTESRDMLDEVEPKLIELQQFSEETGAVDKEIINNVFRLFHSMKGSAGFLGLANVSAVTHEAETLLDLFRKDKATLTHAHTELLCRALDMMHGLLELIEETMGDEGFEEQTAAMVSLLSAAIEQEKRGGAPASPVSQPTAPAASPPASVDTPSAEVSPKIDEFFIEISDDMRERFIQEADELLDKAEQALLSVTEGATDPDVLTEAMRCLHSMKGNCGFMGFADLERLSHRSETVLTGMCQGDISDLDEAAGMLLKILDVLRDGVADLSQDGDGSIQACEVYLELLDDMIPPETAAVMQTPAPAPETSGPVASESSAEVSSSSPDEALESSGPVLLVVDDDKTILELLENGLGRSDYRVKTTTQGTSALAMLKPTDGEDTPVAMITDIRMPDMDGTELIEKALKARPDLPILVMTAYGEKDVLMKLMSLGVTAVVEKPFDLNVLHGKIAEAIKKAKTSRTKPTMPARSVPSGDGQRKTVTRRDIRVDLDKLDRLINLVGELVIAEAMVTGNPDLEGMELENFERASHQLRRITSDLQDVAMAVRMIPLSATFRKMIRLVHDVANKAGKKARLELIGEETEVDKTVIELIADPLVHIVRNSVDHGMEPPEERIDLGKSETGTVTIEGRHEGGEVWILITDDGRGLNREKILTRGIERGLVPGDGSDMREEEIYKLIFEPGFSTAEKITDVSGRGVGMDVVKKNIDRLKGRVDVRSVPGQGTTIILRIPLTLAIIEGMLVRVGEARYTIPMLSIRETVRCEDREQITVTMDGQELVRVREDLIPIVRLHERFNKPPDSNRIEDGILLVIEEDKELLAVLVDEIIGQQQTVIKGLSHYLGDARGVSGCTILGTGEVSLILDVGSLIEEATSAKG